MTAQTSHRGKWVLLEVAILIAVPLGLVIVAVSGIKQSGIVTLVVAIAALVLFFFGFERSKPPLRQIIPTAVLAALAVVGRILFAPIPDFKPVTALCIVAGAFFGRRSGFMVGALAALLSNFFFGQGPWTPWQMYAWGLIGFIAGCISNKRFARHHALLYGYGILASLGYGVLLNTWTLVAFMQPITIGKMVTVYGASLAFDGIHALATLVFLLALYEPWQKILTRMIRKYDLMTE